MMATDAELFSLARERDKLCHEVAELELLISRRVVPSLSIAAIRSSPYRDRRGELQLLGEANLAEKLKHRNALLDKQIEEVKRALVRCATSLPAKVELSSSSVTGDQPGMITSSCASPPPPHHTMASLESVRCEIENMAIELKNVANGSQTLQKQLNQMKFTEDLNAERHRIEIAHWARQLRSLRDKLQELRDDSFACQNKV